MNNNIALSGIVLGTTEIEIPSELRIFLTSNGMDGIGDLEIMLKDPKLSKRIPQNVRYQYETIYGFLSIELDEVFDKLEKDIKKFRSTPRKLIHEIIQQSLDNFEK